MHPHSIFVLTTRGNPNPPLLWYELLLKLEPGNFATNDPTSTFTPSAGLVNGVKIFIDPQMLRSMESKELRILVKGDLIRDKDHHGVDGNHLPPWLPSRPTGDGIEGGAFESWLNLKQ